jgi:hypothetical protein
MVLMTNLHVPTKMSNRGSSDPNCKSFKHARIKRAGVTIVELRMVTSEPVQDQLIVPNRALLNSETSPPTITTYREQSRAMCPFGTPFQSRRHSAHFETFDRYCGETETPHYNNRQASASELPPKWPFPFKRRQACV